MGVPDALRAGNWKLIDRYRTASWEEQMSRYREALDADVFVTGTNAITRAGQLVDMDSSGNRVAATIFGPRKVIVVAGANKVVENLDAAFARIREIAPLNCRRLGHKTPCAETGRCSDCMIPERMCNYIGVVNQFLFQILGEGRPNGAFPRHKLGEITFDLFAEPRFVEVHAEKRSVRKESFEPRMERPLVAERKSRDGFWP